MPAVSGVILLVKTPVPLPSVVWVQVIVGNGLLLQQTPRIVIGEEPAFVILPPDTAAVDVMPFTAVVVIIGNPVVEAAINTLKVHPPGPVIKLNVPGASGTPFPDSVTVCIPVEENAPDLLKEIPLTVEVDIL